MAPPHPLYVQSESTPQARPDFCKSDKERAVQANAEHTIHQSRHFKRTAEPSDIRSAQVNPQGKRVKRNPSQTKERSLKV
jgi:hypothetical protein